MDTKSSSVSMEKNPPVASSLETAAAAVGVTPRDEDPVTSIPATPAAAATADIDRSPLEDPPAKRFKPEGTPRNVASTDPHTPTILSEQDNTVSESQVASADGLSSPSGDSRAAAVGGRLRDSPPLSYVPEVPPAPPSTPASEYRSQHAFDYHSLATPTPMMNSGVENADRLLEQENDLEGAVTPAPTRRVQGCTLTEDFSEWAVGERYQLMRILGRGSYGEVAQARDLRASGPNEYVAIKRIQSPFDQEVDAVRLYREIHILRRLRGHECIIQLLDVVQPPTDDLDDFHDLYLVFEYVDTDLYKLIMSPQYLTTEHIQTFLYQMLAGLKYLHSCAVIHRDLKPANILLNEDCSLKICDFGLARIVDSAALVSSAAQDVELKSDDKEKGAISGKSVPVSPGTAFGKPPIAGLTRQLTKHVVTRWYRAPELILIQPYTSAVDIWSVGCIFAELLSMQEGSVPGYQDRSPLFPGSTCYPLSADDATIKNDERLDQLSVIFGVIGPPTKEDIESIGSANEYIKTLGDIKGKSLEKLYPAADPVALDLLRNMLKFNPRLRYTAEQALEHEFLKGVRRKNLEQAADQPLVGPEFLETDHVDLKILKRKAYEEVLWYRDQRDPQIMKGAR